MLADCIAFVSVMPRTGRAPSKSFGERLELDEETGCWNWTGAKTGDGYGNVKRGGKSIRAHRYAFEKFVGPIPNGACVLHSCDNPACCRPDHLRVGSQNKISATQSTVAGTERQDRGSRSRKSIKSESPRRATAIWASVSAYTRQRFGT